MIIDSTFIYWQCLMVAESAALLTKRLSPLVGRRSVAKGTSRCSCLTNLGLQTQLHRKRKVVLVLSSILLKREHYTTHFINQLESMRFTLQFHISLHTNTHHLTYRDRASTWWTHQAHGLSWMTVALIATICQRSRHSQNINIKLGY